MINIFFLNKPKLWLLYESSSKSVSKLRFFYFLQHKCMENNQFWLLFHVFLWCFILQLLKWFLLGWLAIDLLKAVFVFILKKAKVLYKLSKIILRFTLLLRGNSPVFALLYRNYPSDNVCFIKNIVGRDLFFQLLSLSLNFWHVCYDFPVLFVHYWY